jgi:hypothetical protein
MEIGRLRSTFWSYNADELYTPRDLDRVIPKRKRIPIQDELKVVVIRVLYVESEARSSNATDEFLLVRRKRCFRDREFLDIIRSLESNFYLLMRNPKVFLTLRLITSEANDIGKSVNDKIELRLKMMRALAGCLRI